MGFPPEPKTNFWPYPKALNGFWKSLSGSEQKVLDYILRHTWGFNKVRDDISLSQLKNGIKEFDMGTGLTKPTIISAVRGLVKKGFIKKSKGRYANCYELVKNLDQSSKDSLPIGSKKSLHTIDNITTNNKQYGPFSKKLKPFYMNMPIVEKMVNGRPKKYCIPADGSTWLEFDEKHGKQDIEYRT